jgi:hypothetical protein
MLAGAVHRSLPPTTRVILTGMTIFNRLAPNVSDEEREGATAILGQQFRLYLREMGVQTELIDIIDRHRSQLSITAGNGTAAVRMAQAWHRHDNAAITSPPCGIADLPDSQFIVLPRLQYARWLGKGDAGQVAQTMTAARRARRSGSRALPQSLRGCSVSTIRHCSADPLEVALAGLGSDAGF